MRIRARIAWRLMETALWLVQAGRRERAAYTEQEFKAQKTLCTAMNETLYLIYPQISR